MFQSVRELIAICNGLVAVQSATNLSWLVLSSASLYAANRIIIAGPSQRASLSMKATLELA